MYKEGKLRIYNNPFYLPFNYLSYDKKIHLPDLWLCPRG